MKKIKEYIDRKILEIYEKLFKLTRHNLYVVKQRIY